MSTTRQTEAWWRRACLALTLIAVSCGGADSDEAPAAASSTTTAAPTTTVPLQQEPEDPCDGEPFSIDERGLVLIPGCSYTTVMVASPITFMVDDATWRSSATGSGQVAFLGIDQDDDGSWDADLVFLVLEGRSSPDEIVDLIVAEDWIQATTDRRPVEIGELPGISVDLYADLEPDSTSETCPASRSLRFRTGGRGWILVDASSAAGGAFGIPPCTTVRVWAIATDGGTITALATAQAEDQVENYLPLFEAFLTENVRFEAAG